MTTNSKSILEAIARGGYKAPDFRDGDRLVLSTLIRAGYVETWGSLDRSGSLWLSARGRKALAR